eukprot:CAMPEP_0181477474 /NCGR_PEP_ID=MMETSP1110-20121109/42234_1 /TAXON_ID=174948 /ORGANISM="Symbiodinium sp., Strain CCMP421" /LENGTH=93 /DNA_ID=CAMNT_0023602775 /DNA_START=9 /DNA_END=291 /DNA_ORIENTATION=-
MPCHAAGRPLMAGSQLRAWWRQSPSTGLKESLQHPAQLSQEVHQHEQAQDKEHHVDHVLAALIGHHPLQMAQGALEQSGGFIEVDAHLVQQAI